MIRKDCETRAEGGPAKPNLGLAAAPGGRHGTVAPPLHVALVMLLVHVGGGAALGGSIRVWSTAVVVENRIHLRDLAVVQGPDSAAQMPLGDIVVCDAPPPGGSRIVPIDTIRNALIEAGANLAQVTLQGATECAVTRPASRPAESNADPGNRGAASSGGPGRSSGEHEGAPAGPTLRQAVVEYFNGEAARYGGAAEVTFDRTSDQVLDLSGPAYEFRVRRRGGPQIGLIPLEIDLIADARTLQTVPLVAKFDLRRSVVVARRTINQGATITATDVELTSLSFDRLDDLGVDATAQVVGQRAKRVISAGAMIELDMLEQVPLVLRGQLVTVSTVKGAIRLVTAGKATEEGRLGEVIKVRCLDDTHAELDAIVTGPGEVRVGPLARRLSESRLAIGGAP